MYMRAPGGGRPKREAALPPQKSISHERAAFHPDVPGENEIVAVKTENLPSLTSGGESGDHIRSVISVRGSGGAEEQHVFMFAHPWV